MFDSKTESKNRYSRAYIFKYFLFLTALSFLLRIFYCNHLYEDDGFWIAAAEEVLRGKTLYSEIYFDKPPVLPLFYALLFKLFGTHILTIRLFTIFYAVIISFLLYLFGSMLYDKRKGLIAGAMFVIFSTTYFTGHFQGLNTDFLLVLPYTLSAYLFVRSRLEGKTYIKNLRCLFGGVIAGIGFQINPKVIFIFVFLFMFAVCEIYRDGISKVKILRVSVILFVSGFVAGALPFFVYIAATNSLTSYKIQVWDWGRKYADYYSVGQLLLAGTRRTIGYFSVNGVLFICLLVVSLSIYRSFRDKTNNLNASMELRSNIILLLWFVASYTGMSMGGRFFAHYFFQILPALCLIGARGFSLILEYVASEKNLKGKLVLALLIICFLLSIFRFHALTVFLAVDRFRGTTSEKVKNWDREKENKLELQTAAFVKDKALTEEDFKKYGVEILRKDSNTDYLFIWGYKPEIYFWSGLRPASKFLSVQLMTGVPSDVHALKGASVLIDERTSITFRNELLAELQATTPKYIIDELALRNEIFAMRNYTEFQPFLEQYEPIKNDGMFFIYRRR